MKFLRNPSTREIFSFPADGSEDAFIPGGLEVMTPEDISVHCNPVYQPTRVEVDAERDKRIDGGISFNGAHFQSRPIDRERIIEAAQLALMAMTGGAKSDDLRWMEPEQDFTWITADNTLMPMDAHTILAFATAVAARTRALVLAGRRLKDMEAVPCDYTSDKWWQ